ncbi:hypothetical protein FQA47_003059 [Oryzias melastigma]|uniref:Uncharacterized protein n=1 Tax=Oryzias melastigma TaxID=30732 RepID=A0A834CPX7_ORYME|nr:hypothetical protein FQA47_003059 [Oryzias melastigma]
MTLDLLTLGGLEERGSLPGLQQHCGVVFVLESYGECALMTPPPRPINKHKASLLSGEAPSSHGTNKAHFGEQSGRHVGQFHNTFFSLYLLMTFTWGVGGGQVDRSTYKDSL